MALEWLPSARRAPIAGQPGFAWQVDCPPKICLHTTEGGNGVPSYTPGLKAPHATILVNPGVGVDIVQHIPLDRASYSLMHPAGIVPTNGAHAFQFELAGTSEKGGPGYYWPDADTAVLRDLYAKVIKPIADAYGVQLIAPQFKAYPASYGSSNGVRLSGPAFLAWRGVLGHEHVPGNEHGDPGAFPWARLLEIAHSQPFTPPEDDVPLTPADIAAIADASAKAIHSQQIYRQTWVGADGKDHPLLFADAILAAARKQFPTADQVAAAVKAALTSIPAGTTTLDAAAIDKVADAVLAKLGARLK